MRARKQRLHRQRRVDRRQGRHAPPDPVFGREGRDHRFHQGARQRSRSGRHPRQLRRAGRRRDAAARSAAAGIGTQHHAQQGADGPASGPPTRSRPSCTSWHRMTRASSRRSASMRAAGAPLYLTETSRLDAGRTTMKRSVDTDPDDTHRQPAASRPPGRADVRERGRRAGRCARCSSERVRDSVREIVERQHAGRRRRRERRRDEQAELRHLRDRAADRIRRQVRPAEAERHPRASECREPLLQRSGRAASEHEPPRAATVRSSARAWRRPRADIANFKQALVGVPVEDAFMTAASPGVVSMFLGNTYYKTEEEFLWAVAEAMKPEYEAIVRRRLRAAARLPGPRDDAASRVRRPAARGIPGLRARCTSKC